jgi:membrane protein implicated in regulation of membrane protease activity
MFIFAVIYLVSAVAVASIVYAIGSGIAALCHKIFTKNDLKIAIISAAIITIVLCVAISPAASRAEEFPDEFYYDVYYTEFITE